MGEDVPRRLKRFQRQDGAQDEELIDFGEPSRAQEPNEDIGESLYEQSKNTKEEQKNKTMKIALTEVKKFKDEHKRLPTKNEYDEIAESIFNQLKEKEDREKAQLRAERKTAPRKRPERKRGGRKEEAEAEPEPLAEPAKKDKVSSVLGELKGMDVGDLFGEGKKSAKKKAGGQGEEELGELEGLAFEGEDKFSMEGFDGETDSKPVCPNCKAPATDIIYCPGCGAAYCAKCAKKVEELAGKKKYFCPKCGQTVDK